MSTEKTLSEKFNPSTLNVLEEKNKRSSRVDINHLLERVRKEKQKENKTNLVFFGLFAALVLIAGILLSL
jgi:Pyruvate/2-oxoacid:ferredoxin oxidoreductase gamma subunit|tara:strand:- start:187 stop:396 length:210 start_codon:yes stop_codon:yes gene_type:complete